MGGLSIRHVSKRFGHVEALRGVSLDVATGEIVALLGDNGAGKSTLAKVMSGHHAPTEGHVLLNGRQVAFDSARAAQAAGVEMVYQDLALAPDLTVAENVFLGRELPRPGAGRWLGMLDRREMADETSRILATLSIHGLSAATPVEELSGGQRQAVAIARSLLRARTALLLDEPTAALGPRQSDLVCRAIERVAERQIAVLVVSHDLERMLRTATRIIVLHRGRVALDSPAAGLTVPLIVAAMMGDGQPDAKGGPDDRA